MALENCDFATHGKMKWHVIVGSKAQVTIGPNVQVDDPVRAVSVAMTGAA
jgi:hypothetical protein